MTGVIYACLTGLCLSGQASAACDTAYKSRWDGIVGAIEGVLRPMPGDADLQSMHCIELENGLREKSLPIAEAQLGNVSLIAALVDQPINQRRGFPADGYWDRELAAVVHQNRDIRVDLSLSAPDLVGRLHLDCSAAVRSPAGKQTTLLKGQKCFNAVPHGVTGKYEPTRLKLTFKHSGAGDEEGRWTVVLRVRDRDSKEQAELRLPYNFRVVYAE